MPFLTPLSRAAPPSDGPAAFQAARDLRPLIGLLREAFAVEMDDEDRRWLDDLSRLIRWPPILTLLRWLPLSKLGWHGFVWYEAGRLVGNVSLLRRSDELWLIANVVTDPGWRRSGIARQLMLQAIDWARQGHVCRLELEVRADNEPAQSLYRRLGFERKCSIIRMRAERAHLLRPPPDAPDGLRARPWSAGDGPAIRRLLATVGIQSAEDAAGPLALAFRGGAFDHGYHDSFHRRRSFGVVCSAKGLVVGVLAGSLQGRDRPHVLELASSAEWRGRVEVPLLAAALHQLAASQDGAVEMRLRSDELPARALALAMGFAATRTMDRLQLRLTPAT